jgi:hypothetical protein
MNRKKPRDQKRHLVLPPLFGVLMGLPLPMKIAIVISLLAPLGFVMGLPFLFVPPFEGGPPHQQILISARRSADGCGPARGSARPYSSEKNDMLTGEPAGRRRRKQ